jgi:hypothetical protein
MAISSGMPKDYQTGRPEPAFLTDSYWSSMDGIVHRLRLFAMGA